MNSNYYQEYDRYSERGRSYTDGARRAPARRPEAPATRRPAPYTYQQSPYARGGRNMAPEPPAKKRGGLPRALVALLILAFLVGAGIFVYIRATTIAVTVNGQRVEMRSGARVSQLIEEGYASPQAGDFVAIDGTVITPGAGTQCTVTANGSELSVDDPLADGATIVIGDGKDVTEDSVVTQQAIPAQSHNDSNEFSAYWSGSLHLMRDAQDGVRTVRTGAVSGKTISEDTVPAIDGGYRVLTASPSQPVVALTFDDGPWPETTWAILDVLEQYGAKATFFTIGQQCSGYPDTISRMVGMGCELLTHSYDHAAGSGQGVNICYMSADEQVWELTAGYQAIADMTGQEPAHIFRAPGGNFYGDAVWNLWPYADAEIGWDVDTMDWSRPGVDAIVSAILSVQPGQVVLMHDGGGDRWQTVEALRQALPVLIERGYSFVTVSELIAMV